MSVGKGKENYKVDNNLPCDVGFLDGIDVRSTNAPRKTSCQ